jgi:DNA-binding transcriptional LysR family regulator
VHVDLPVPFSITGTESFRDAALLGLGLAQLPMFHVEQDLKEGRLVRVLADRPLPSQPVSILYPRSRQLSPRVRLFMEWATHRFRRTASPR